VGAEPRVTAQAHAVIGKIASPWGVKKLHSSGGEGSFKTSFGAEGGGIVNRREKKKLGAANGIGGAF